MTVVAGAAKTAAVREKLLPDKIIVLAITRPCHTSTTFVSNCKLQG
jgi:hypothetical protein